MSNSIIIRGGKIVKPKIKIVRPKLRRILSFLTGRKMWITKIKKGDKARLVPIYKNDG